MNSEYNKIQSLLKQALPPVDPEPRRDLWPSALGRLQERSVAPAWYEWAMAAAVVLFLLLFPRAIPVLLYHL
jgi:hypothetical protein